MLKKIKFGDNSIEPKLGSIVELRGQDCEVVACQETGVLMLNIDADELAPGDLKFIKRLGLTISNPETDEPIALGVELKKETTVAEAVATYLSTRSYDDDDDDDDSSFFGNTGFLGNSSRGGFSSTFGGFSGGMFSGGGASRSW